MTVISYVTIGRNKARQFKKFFPTHESHLIVPESKEQQQPRENYNLKKLKTDQ